MAGQAARTSFGPSSAVKSLRFSVPALTPLTAVRTGTCVGPIFGSGASPTSSRPSSGAISTFIRGRPSVDAVFPDEFPVDLDAQPRALRQHDAAVPKLQWFDQELGHQE